MNHTRLAGAALALAALGGAAVVSVAGALPATAAVAAPAAPTINAPNYNRLEVGYEQQSPTAKNQIRGTVTIPAGSKVSQVVGLQLNTNGGPTYALGLIYDPFNSAVNGGPGFILAELTDPNLANFKTGTPLGNLSAGSFTPVATLNTPAGHTLFSSQTGGSYYLEVRLSTLLNVVNFVAGPSETDAATLDYLVGGITLDGFTAPFVAGATFNSVGLTPSTTLASWTRIGTTTAQDGTRVTFDAESLDVTEATANGGAPTLGNIVTMLPLPALPGTGSAWAESSGS